MKKCYVVYYSDKTANVVLAVDATEIPSIVGEKFSTCIRVECIPYEVL